MRTESLNELSEKRYIGARLDTGLTVMVHEPGNPHYLPARTDLVNESEKFDWGSGIAEAAQLALAILADATSDDDFARKHYKKFLWDFVAQFPFGHWSLTHGAVASWVRMIKAEEAA